MFRNETTRNSPRDTRRGLTWSGRPRFSGIWIVKVQVEVPGDPNTDNKVALARVGATSLSQAIGPIGHRLLHWLLWVVFVGPIPRLKLPRVFTSPIDREGVNPLRIVESGTTLAERIAECHRRWRCHTGSLKVRLVTHVYELRDGVSGGVTHGSVRDRDSLLAIVGGLMNRTALPLSVPARAKWQMSGRCRGHDRFS